MGAKLTVTNNSTHEIRIAAFRAESDPLHHAPISEQELQPEAQHVFEGSGQLRFRFLNSEGEPTHFVCRPTKGSQLVIRDANNGVSLWEAQEEGEVEFTQWHPSYGCFPCLLSNEVYAELWKHYESLMEELKELSATAKEKQVTAARELGKEVELLPSDNTNELEEKAEELKELVQFFYPNDRKKLLQIFLPSALGGIGLGAAAPAVFMGILSAMGFGAGGVVAGSAAATIQSTIGAGSAFATATSVGAAGLSVGATAGIAVFGTLVATAAIGGAGFAIHNALKHTDECERCWNCCFHVHNSNGRISERVDRLMIKYKNILLSDKEEPLVPPSLGFNHQTEGAIISTGNQLIPSVTGDPPQQRAMVASATTTTTMEGGISWIGHLDIVCSHTPALYNLILRNTADLYQMLPGEFADDLVTGAGQLISRADGSEVVSQLRDSIDLGTTKGHVWFKKVSNTCAFPTLFSALSIAVGQYHLHQINASLYNIKESLDHVQFLLEADDWSELLSLEKQVIERWQEFQEDIQPNLHVNRELCKRWHKSATRLQKQTHKLQEKLWLKAKRAISKLSFRSEENVENALKHLVMCLRCNMWYGFSSLMCFCYLEAKPEEGFPTERRARKKDLHEIMKGEKGFTTILEEIENLSKTPFYESWFSKTEDAVRQFLSKVGIREYHREENPLFTKLREYAEIWRLDRINALSLDDDTRIVYLNWIALREGEKVRLQNK